MQTLKLGLAGSEVTLPTESRINKQGAPIMKTVDAESVNGSIHTDFVSFREGFDISWDTISQSDFNTIYSLVKLQLSSATFLSFIYDDEDGVFSTITVKATITSKGTLIQRDKFFYSGFGISLEQVTI